MKWLHGVALGALWVTVLSVAVVGCKKREVGAKEHFGAEHSCPEDQVTVKPRPDLDWMELTLGVLEPPPEVAADPAQLAKWQAAEARRKAKQNEVFEVSGCGHHDYVACFHPRAVVTCSSMKVGEPSAGEILDKLTKSHEELEKAQEKLLKELRKSKDASVEAAEAQEEGEETQEP